MEGTESSAAVEIAADVRTVWGVLEEVRLLPELSSATVAVEGPDRLDHVGQRFRQTVVVAGRRFTSEWTVLELVPHDRLVVEGSVLPGVRYRMREQVERLGADRTRLTVGTAHRVPFGPLGRLARRLGLERLAREGVQEVLTGIRHLAEARAGLAPRP